jgi:hypothetical protein
MMVENTGISVKRKKDEKEMPANHGRFVQSPCTLQ